MEQHDKKRSEYHFLSSSFAYGQVLSCERARAHFKASNNRSNNATIDNDILKFIVGACVVFHLYKFHRCLKKQLHDCFFFYFSRALAVWCKQNTDDLSAFQCLLRAQQVAYMIYHIICYIHIEQRIV